MKNLKIDSIRGNQILTLAFLFMLSLGRQNIKAQSFCQTVGGDGSIGVIGNGSGFPGNVNGPLFLRIYVHAVGQDDGSDAPTPEQIRESIAILEADFAPHNIFFVWDCNIIPINSTTLYSAGGFSNIYCDLPQYSSHPDGIDIFIGGDGAPSYGAATNIPSKSFLIKGSWGGVNGACTGIVEWINSRSQIMSHEMGHCLGLWHTHHGEETGGTNCDGNPWDPQVCQEFVNGSNGATCGDYVPDTPADPGLFPCYPNIYNNCIFDWFWTDPNNDVYNPDETLIMSYTHEQCMTAHSVGQGERMRQMILFSPILQACLVNPDFVGHTITTNTTWTTANTPNNGNFLIENDLVIEGGATLTINAGVTVHFAEQSRLIIKPNARLVLNGTLTGMGCRGYTWQGVKVWGSGPSQSQYVVGGVRAQGRIECKAGSLIENAKVGIQLYGPTYTLASGQISCTGATIKNCPIGVEFAPYQNFWPFSVPPGQQGQPRNYVGSFGTTTFLADDDYPHAEPFYAFVHMTGVNGIGLSGCSYTNARTITGGSIVDWGYGIFANDAGFNVTATGVGNTYPPSSYIFSGFNGLGYGIYTARIVTNRPYTVRQANFNNCFVGIRNKSVTGGTLLFNNFNLGELPSTDPTGDQAGVIFETDVAGFTCEENDFKDGGGNAETTIGTICINTGIANKTIRRNNFHDLTFGSLSNQQNASQLPQDGIRGLYYDCNKNFDVLEKDFSVPDGRIRAKQGLEIVIPGQPSSYNAAGNRFSYTRVDFSNLGAAIEYFFNPNGQNEEPLAVQGNITKILAPPNTCPTTYCEPPCKTKEEREIIKSDFYVRRSAYQSLKSDYALNPTEEKARQMAYYQRAMDEDAYMVVVHELYDTISFNADTLRTWIANMGSIEGDLWLADERLGIGNSSTAITLLNAAITKYQLTGDEQTDIDNYKAIVSILSGKPFYSLDEATLQSVKGYLEASGYAEGWAKSIVTLYGEHFPAEYVKEGQGGERSSEGDNVRKGANQPEFVVAKPNPARDFVDFSISLPVDAVDVSIRIFDVNGRQVEAQNGLSPIDSFTWSTDGYSAGVYFYHLIADGKILHSGKIVLNK